MATNPKPDAEKKTEQVPLGSEAEWTREVVDQIEQISVLTKIPLPL